MGLVLTDQTGISVSVVHDTRATTVRKTMVVVIRLGIRVRITDAVNYACYCDSLHTGIHCETPVSNRICDSVPPPCLSGGTCHPLLSEQLYECICLPGYRGRHCEVSPSDVIIDCTANPCLNGGICVNDGSGTSVCNCSEGFAGDLCQVDLLTSSGPGVTSCSVNPCLNNGTCIPDAASEKQVSCHCMKGYEGNHCELASSPVNLSNTTAMDCGDGEDCFTVPPPNQTSTRGAATTNSLMSNIGGCAARPCRNNGTCTTLQGGSNFSCTCQPGYTGTLCEEDINECETGAKDVCNYGICVNTNGSYQCFCRPGFAGDHCDVDFDECLSYPCFNGATCQNKINGFTCVCAPGYTGKECSININECESSPCLHGATCIDEVATFSCVCPKGLTGRLCETNIDDCESGPCLNGGICKDLLNNYTCNCQNTGYSGLHCELNIDDCAPNPCKNGAHCVDKVKDFQCECYPGYTGKTCADDIRECDTNPCQFGGTCLEHSNLSLYQKHNEPTIVNLPKIFSQEFNYSTAEGYECLCVPGTAGGNCEININECESNPCRWGACIDKVGGYVCECEPGFEGDNCEVDINECDRFSPCKHGSCIDKRASYYCDCVPQYGGKNCSVELTGCSGPDTCLNGGSCKPYLVDETEHRFNCTCPNGYHGKTCEKITTMSFNGFSHIMLNTTREEGYDISFRFKTTLPSGLLAIGKGSTYYILELVNGRLNLHSSLLNKWEGVFIGSHLNDSQWQKLFVAINSSHLVLAANEEQTIYPINPITQYEQPTSLSQSQTSFPTTFVGGAVSSLLNLAHYKAAFVGCIENVVINGQWVLPEDHSSTDSIYHNVTVGCPRTDQCSNPNPCHNGGRCTDLWRDFSCACIRPFLGHKCQYNFTAATFGHENTSNSLVSVGGVARRAVRNIVDISMFIRTRQLRGAIFYLGGVGDRSNSNSGSGNTGSGGGGNTPTGGDETTSYIAAEMEAGELYVRLQFNSTPESYNVGGVKLADGNNHLIQVVRNVTLVQVKLNGTEYFRKTISATGILDVQVLYLGGIPESVHHHRSIRSHSRWAPNYNMNSAELPIMRGEPYQSRSRFTRQTSGDKQATPLPNFKGIIHDVQISNGSRTMVVEFFPLQVQDLSIPPSFGNVSFETSTILEGVVSDNACASNPCEYGGTCIVTWNDFNCICTRGHKSKTCSEKEFCQLKTCPTHSECRNLNNGYECVANRTFNVDSLLPTNTSLQYSFLRGGSKLDELGSSNSTLLTPLDSISLSYRSRHNSDRAMILIYIAGREPKVHFSIYLYKEWIYISWLLAPQDTPLVRKLRKESPLDEWTYLKLNVRDNHLSGGIQGDSLTALGSDTESLDSTLLDVASNNFTYTAWVQLVTTGRIYLGGGDVTPSMPVSMDPASPSYMMEDLADSSLGTGGNALDFVPQDNTMTTGAGGEEWIQQTSSGYFKGCLGEVRLGDLLLPYFTWEQLAYTDTLSCPECFSLEPNPLYTSEDMLPAVLGCVLCADSYCENGAKCADPVSSYACACLPGFAQENCTENIDECASNVCQNGATCVDNGPGLGNTQNKINTRTKPP
uniref:Protein crumbs n=1 Tax=Cacopsylla melanoneura TaxID=428564 RepID=A0A8D9E0W6_9HEMI